MRQDVKEFANTYQYPDPSTPNALEQMWSDIKQMLSVTVEKRVPSKTSAARHTNPWITTSIRRAIRRKQRAHKKARMTGKKKDVDRYRRIQAQTRYEVRQASRKYLEDVVSEDYRTNSKRFWSYVKSKKQEADGVAPLKDKQGFLSSNRKETTIFLHGNGDVSSHPKMAAHAGTRMFIICFLGIFSCYFVFGLLQETITKAKYGEKGEQFHYTLSLVFVQCIINAFFARLGMAVVKEHDHTPRRMFAVCSLTYLGAMVASNHSLQHVSYPTQVLGKSVKPIPVMILGVLFAGKRYPVTKYFFVLMIVIGVALFIYKDDKASTASDSHTMGVGEMLLLVSLTLDGLTGATQDRMRGEHKTAATSMMFAVNAYSVLWLAVGLLLTGEIFEFVGFVGQFPYVIANILLFSVCSAAGQMFIFKTVTAFGPLTCSIFTTTRKFFTILCSIAFFGHPMNGRQWVGTVLVFIGLFLDGMYGKPLKTATIGRL
ncbi:hypothetical protein ACOMHN_040479 [Nucella lapillus]